MQAAANTLDNPGEEQTGHPRGTAEKKCREPEDEKPAESTGRRPMEMAQCVLYDPSMPKSTKSHLMKVLRESGVARNEPFGRGRLLTLRRDDLNARFPGLIDAVQKGDA